MRLPADGRARPGRTEHKEKPRADLASVRQAGFLKDDQFKTDILRPPDGGLSDMSGI